ncbi:MAG: hypothetical protein R3362_04080 [Rhodothermales bacterium]|nr:hypothetical protein [Rhodothermales bacterium]
MEGHAGTLSVEQITSVVSSLFAELNIGLFIYHLEDPDRPRSLRLIYANTAASTYTGSDLHPLVGLTITEAFPGLADTDLPETYAEVVETGRSRNLGAFEYPGDERVARGHFSVKAFPMPQRCVGIVFENISTRKRVDEMVKKQRESGRRP